MGRRGGYSCSSTFTFTVERPYDKETGEFYLEENAPDYPEDKLEWAEISLEVSGNSWYSPGEYSRLPEDCYPDDGDTEVESITDLDNRDWSNLLTSQELKEVYSELESNCKYSC